MHNESVIAFPEKEVPEDIYQMTLPQLQNHYAAMREELRALDEAEPQDPGSEAYENWADEHEELEDYLDEILDRMETFL